MERAALQRDQALAHELGAAVDEARLLGAVHLGAIGDTRQVGLVDLAEIGGVGVGIAPFSRIHATAADVSSPPENAMPTRSPTGAT